MSTLQAAIQTEIQNILNPGVTAAGFRLVVSHESGVNVVDKSIDEASVSTPVTFSTELHGKFDAFVVRMSADGTEIGARALATFEIAAPAPAPAPTPEPTAAPVEPVAVVADPAPAPAPAPVAVPTTLTITIQP